MQTGSIRARRIKSNLPQGILLEESSLFEAGYSCNCPTFALITIRAISALKVPLGLVECQLKIFFQLTFGKALILPDRKPTSGCYSHTNLEIWKQIPIAASTVKESFMPCAYRLSILMLNGNPTLANDKKWAPLSSSAAAAAALLMYISTASNTSKYCLKSFHLCPSTALIP